VDSYRMMPSRLLKLSFGQKRKTLWNNLKSTSKQLIASAMGEAKVKHAARETLSLRSECSDGLCLGITADG